MGVFDFLKDLPYYDERDVARERIEKRHEILVTPFKSDICGARVLDLAAHDGRWSYAFAAAGAAEVVGIEGRQDLIDRFALFPPKPWTDRITLRCGDIFDALDADIAAGEA